MSSHENNSLDSSPSHLYRSFHSDAPLFGGTHFVGSPGQINLGEPSTPPIRPIPSFGSLPSSSQRPQLQRSVSHTIAHSRRTRPPVSAPQKLRESFRVSLARPTLEPQWSLFEQLMENEGQLMTSGPRARRNIVNASRRSQFSSSRALAPEPASTNVDQFHSASQSPVHGHRDLRALVEPEVSNESPSEFESEDGSQVHEGSSSTTVAPPPASSHCFLRLQVPTVPVLWRNVFKCAVAYLLASLFTFSPYLSGFFSDISTSGPGNSRPSPTGHMIASMYALTLVSFWLFCSIICSAVYYNPAKTIGGMMEADSYCSIAFLYAAFVCLGSMSMFWSLEVLPGWEWLGDALVILWVGISMWGLTWMKVWMAKPTFNSGMS